MLSTSLETDEYQGADATERTELNDLGNATHVLSPEVPH